MSHGRSGLDGLAEDLAFERRAVEGRSAVYARALDLLPEVLEGPPGRLLAAAWEQRTFFAPYDRPLLLLAALRADARAEGPGHPLHRALAARPASPGAVTRPALQEALAPRRERVWEAVATRLVQTNETSRAVAWLWPAALALAHGGRRPLLLADIGASAGLNLVADVLPAPWTFEDGTPVPVVRGAEVIARLGLDANPLDANGDSDADWLRACIWPDEDARQDRLEAALAAFRAARTRADAPVLVPIGARNVPARLDLLSAAEVHGLVVAYQTVMRDYLSPDERDEYAAGVRDWIATHPPGHALWMELEPVPDPHDPALSTSLVAHLREVGGGVRTLELARCAAHPTVLRVNGAAVAALEAAFAAAAAHRPSAPP